MSLSEIHHRRDTENIARSFLRNSLQREPFAGFSREDGKSARLIYAFEHLRKRSE
jgi:hypothetical protein